MMMGIEESPRRSSGHSSSSPEFEFWVVGNHPKLEPDDNLISADELIVDGVLLPLQLLSLSNSQPILLQDSKSQQQQEAEVEAPPPTTLHPESSICSSSSSSSKRWKDIFRVGDRKKETAKDKERINKDNRKVLCTTTTSTTTTTNSSGSAELNINIWPFSRSRSAGTANPARPKVSAMRKSSSAPCSRSNSRGESSTGRRWAASPGRPGVHVGRASPVWQVKRRSGPREKWGRKGGVGGLGLSVNSCIGYGGAQGRCRGDDSDGVTAGERNNGNLFRFRALFSKKVY